MSLTSLVIGLGIFVAALGSVLITQHIDGVDRANLIANIAAVVLGLLIVFATAAFPSWPDTAFGAVVP